MESTQPAEGDRRLPAVDDPGRRAQESRSATFSTAPSFAVSRLTLDDQSTVETQSSTTTSTVAPAPPSSPPSTLADPPTTVSTEAPTTTTTTSPPAAEPSVQAELIRASFDAAPNAGFGVVSAGRLGQLFGASVPWLGGEGSLELREGALRVRYRPESDGSSSVAFPVHFPTATDVTLSYRLLLEPGWEFVRGGKLPGLAGGTMPTGGAGGNGTDGFSARMMWRGGGSLVVYAYHPDRPSQWGEDYTTTVQLPVGRWVTISERVVMNDPASSDGLVEVWVDGERVLHQTGIRWRTDDSFGVDSVLFSTFYGGGDSSWSPTADRFARFDDFSVRVAG